MRRAVAGGGANAADAEAEADGDGVRLLSASFNQDMSSVAAATTAADLRVFSCSPFREELRRVLPAGTVGDGYAVVAVEMLLRSGILAVVAAATAEGDRHKHRVVVWDDARGQPISDFLDFRSAVRGVRLSRDYLAVVFDRVVRVYPLCGAAASRPLWKIPTAANPRGLCCLSCHVDARVLACPGIARGEVRVHGLPAPGKKPGATRFVAAHGSDLACMALAVDGAVLATASATGTLVRVFSTVDGACLQQVRRGMDSAEIYSIALSPELKWLAVCSDKGTLHVFSLRVGGEGRGDEVGCPHKQQSGGHQAAPSVVQTNTRSSLSFMKVNFRRASCNLNKAFSSEWSFAQFRLPETTRYVTAFGEENTVMIIGMDGSFHRCSFDPVKGKEMVRKEYFRFLNNKDSPPVRTLAA